MGSLVDLGGRLRHYSSIAAGSMGLTGGRAVGGPLHAQIGICDPCNHRCVMCWDHPSDGRGSASTADRFGALPQELMSFEKFESIVEDLHALGTRRLDLVGRGEPLLNPAALDMVSLAKSRGMLVVLCTNASRLTPETSRRLISMRLDRLNVSLNAGRPETYPRIHETESKESYLAIKENLKGLARYRSELRSELPTTRLSFVISSRNYLEITEMIETTREVGAHEAMFVHVVTHEGTPDLALSEGDYQRLISSIPAARETSERLGVLTNLKTQAATVPSYLGGEIVGPAVVPCYVGWYFANILANGSVMPCCQCARPLGVVTSEVRFKDIWRSAAYDAFRRAAKRLPEKSALLSQCECDRCMLRPRNVSLHNLLHPWKPIAIGEKDQLFRLRDLVRLKKSVE